MKLSVVIKLTILLCSLSYAASVAAQVTTGDPELDPIFNDFVSGKGAERLAALDALAALPREDTRQLLEGILEADLMIQKDSDTVVWAVKQGREFSIQSLDKSTDLGVVKKRALKRLKIDNKIRTYLRDIIAGLGLRSDNPTQRLSAVEALLDKPQSISEEDVEKLLVEETDPDILHALGLLKTRQQINSDEAETRAMGLAALQNDLTAESRQLVAQIAESDEDEAVKAIAIRVQQSHEQQVKMYGYLETVFFGLSLGSVLVLAAIGLAISFGVMGVINMAHGELIMLGAYCAWAMQKLLPESITASLLLSIPVAFIFTGLVGILIERTVIRHLYGRALETLLATFGISLILQQLVRTFVSPQNVPVANPSFMSGVWQINGVFSLTLNRLYILIFCLLVFALLALLLKYSRFGLEVRAVSQNRAMARAMGVASSRIDSLTFGLGAGIAGVAGVALSQVTNVGPNLGQSYIVDSFMVVVFGGVGNLWGTLVSGMTLGIANKFLEPWAGAILAKILVLVFLIIFIQRRPRGLFPQRGRAAEAF
ncbi:MAG: urea ABC transporter permease subunit UrtB [Granulosicoccus sp.]|nr:urea ABC transporter permease subunit UrtB [Granulosicoccus sp.]